MAKVKLSKAKTAIIIIAAIIFALLVAGGIYCVATDQSPMMTERMILICLQLIFQANILLKAIKSL